MNELNMTDEIRLLVEDYCRIIGSQDTAKFRRLWTGKANTLISIGTLFDGIDRITEDFLIGCIQKAYTSIRLIADDIDIRLIDDSHGLVIFRYHTECIRRENGDAYGIKGLETQLVVKMENGWKLQHIHYSKQ